MVPSIAMAQGEEFWARLPDKISMTAFLIISGLLILSILLLFVFWKRFYSKRQALKALSAELDHARQRLTETKKTLETTDQNLKGTTQHYQKILLDAQVGIFLVELDGTTSYINSALEEISGLYPKKALKEGIQCVIHPDDRERFNQEWEAFTKSDTPLITQFRFKRARGGKETHVLCKAAKIFNDHKDTESYMGWITDITPVHEEQHRLEVTTSHYARFINETVESYYQLTPENPIPLCDSSEKMAKAILSNMILTSCNETFAALYESTPAAISGKHIDTLDGGCGPLNNIKAIQQLMEADYVLLDFESIHQNPRGNRVILLNHVIGLVEDNNLVGIWGAQRNISQQKREKEALTSQIQFMHRILDTLPAEVHVKDTRCRYLYANRKLADRTGIPPEDWIGKTIFEIMPDTPRNYDKSAIEVMKSGKPYRSERTYETPEKNGWIESIQIPFISNEGLVEGVVELSTDITDLKGKELDAQQKILHKLELRDAELKEKQKEFLAKIQERKQIEKELRDNENILISQQKELKKQLAARLAELETETDKRKKWEELILIKEDELRKIEQHANDQNRQFEEEIINHKQTEAQLKTSQAELQNQRKSMETLIGRLKKEITDLLRQKQKELSSESAARKQAESLLKKTKILLQNSQAQTEMLSKQHATELEREITERKAALEKLHRNTVKLEELKQQLSSRIEEETKHLKKELAQKQIREKALRQQENELEDRIKKLKAELQIKDKKYNEQLQAHKKAETLRKQAEEKLAQINLRKDQLVEREVQKQSINIAEIRIGEAKLRKQIGDLQQEKEQLENELKEMRTNLKASQSNTTTSLKPKDQAKSEVHSEQP